MIKRLKIIGVLVVGAFALGQAGQIHAADANPPERMTYQGYLVDGNGDPLGNSAPANYDVIFRIYKAKSGGEPVWAEQQTVTVDKGYFSVLLGEGSSSGNEPRSEQISTAFVGADISDRFIGITVSGLGGVDLEIAPRLRLVASPFAFTATQARNVSDGSGNRNLFREVDNSNNASLKLGAGSTPTLTLQEAGDATLAGKLTIDLPAAGVGLEIKEQGTSTKFGGVNGDRFSMSTARGGFHFDKSIYVDGDIYSFNRDARLYPSDNTDNFLNVNHDGDTIDAYTDKFYVRDHGVSYLEIDPTSSALNLLTDASSFYMNKQLSVSGSATVSGNVGIGTENPSSKLNVYAGGLYDSPGFSSKVCATLQVGRGGGSVSDDRGTGAILEFRHATDDRYVTVESVSEGLYSQHIGLRFRTMFGASGVPGERMRISSQGNVGIGTDSPSSKLTVNGWIGRTAHHTGGLVGGYNNVGGSSSKTNPIYIIGSSYKPNEGDLGGMYGIGYSHPNASFITGNASEWGLYVAAGGTANAFISGYAPTGRSYIKSKRGGLGVGTDSPNTAAALTASGENSTLGYGSWPMSLYITNPGNDLGVIAGPGRIAMGFHGPNRKVYFIDEQEDHYTATLSEGGAWWTNSDINLKKDIEDLGNVLDKLELIRGVKYKYTYNKSNEPHIGVIAQEVEKHFPELVDVMMDGDGENGAQEKPHLGVSYDGFAPVLIEAVKELRAEKDEQLARKDKRINELENRLAKLEELVSKIGQGQ